MPTPHCFFSDSGDLVAAYPELEAQTGGVAAVASAVLPMVENGQPLGVIVLDFREPHDFTPDERTLPADAGRTVRAGPRPGAALQHLEQQVQDRTTELEAFVRFTELADGETDVLALAARAGDVLGLLFPGSTNGYYVLDNDLWKLKVYSGDLEDKPGAAEPRSRLGCRWIRRCSPSGDADRRAGIRRCLGPRARTVAPDRGYQRVATYPLCGRHHPGDLRPGPQAHPELDAASQAVFRSVGRSLKLALERTETARQLGVRTPSCTPARWRWRALPN